MQSAPPTKPLVILGCTASGKSTLAEALALHLSRPILVVDSMQVYRGMDIGTAKPDAETRARIPHFMIDLVNPSESYSAARFVAEARPLLATSPPPILVAGTLLYLRSLIEGLFEGPGADEGLRAELNARAAEAGTPALHAELAMIDPLAARRIHPNDLRRIVRALEVHRLTGTPISALQTQWTLEHPPAQAVYVGLRWDKEALSRRINARVKMMMQQGLVEEVERIRKQPGGFSEEAGAAVGYRQLLVYFAGKCTLDEAVEQIKIQTRYLAKMQRTWLKRWPPAGQVHWLDVTDTTAPEELINATLQVIHAA